MFRTSMRLAGLLANALSAAPSVLAIYALVAVLQGASGFHRPALEALTQKLARPDEFAAVAALSTLAPEEQISFPRLQELLDMTAGNLSTHLRKLEDAGYADVLKTHKGRTPITYIALTTRGRRAFEDYMAALRGVLGEQR